jgi:hypothetical protein
MTKIDQQRKGMEICGYLMGLAADLDRQAVFRGSRHSGE